MKNNNIIQEELNRVKQLWGYDTSKTIFEQQRGDANSDGIVDQLDSDWVTQNWLQAGDVYDSNDGIVNLDDLTLVTNNFGQGQSTGGGCPTNGRQVRTENCANGMGWWVNCLTVSGNEPQVGQFFAPTWPGSPGSVEIKQVQPGTGNEHHDVSTIPQCTGQGGPGGGSAPTGPQFPGNWNPQTWWNTFLPNAVSKPWYATKKCKFFENRINHWNTQLQSATGVKFQNMLTAKIGQTSGEAVGEGCDFPGL